MSEDKPKRHLRVVLESGKFVGMKHVPQPAQHGGAAEMRPPIRPTEQKVTLPEEPDV